MAIILRALRLRVKTQTLREGCEPLIDDITQLLRARMEETSLFQFMRSGVVSDTPVTVPNNFLEQPEPVNEISLCSDSNWNQIQIDQQVIEDMLAMSEVDQFFSEFM